MTGAIRCENVWKRYRLQASGYRTLRDDLSALLRRANPMRRSQDRDRFLWALQELSLTVEPGQALGIIGRNGSGKSTFLKLLAGVTYPTRGTIEVRGRIGPLIEVGAGIHPELTGRENIYLHGSVIGLSRREVARKFDRIVDFAELSEFLDVPVKRYSSGMKIRLGFSIAAHVDPDILLVDEVLAVGDALFQRKCIEKIRGMLSSGVTILFVSHELATLERLCPQALWLDHGCAQRLGPSADIVAAYLDDVEAQFAAKGDGIRSPAGLVLRPQALAGSDGRRRTVFRSGEALTVTVGYESPEEFAPGQVAVKITDDRMRTITLAVWQANGAVPWHAGQGTIRCALGSLPLSPRVYEVWAQVLRREDFREEVPWTRMASFQVIDERGVAETAILPSGREAPILTPQAQWQIGADLPTVATPQGATSGTSRKGAGR